MTSLLAIFTCRKGNETLLRHWPYFLRQQASDNIVITTTNSECIVPDQCGVKRIGVDSYINGDHLPRRMLDTMEQLLELQWDVLILAEYDTVFFRPIPIADMKFYVAGHLAGFETWSSKAKKFYHNPHVLKREVVPGFIERGRKAIEEGVCGKMTHDAYGLPESSPDVFFGYICQELGLVVEDDLWWEFSRNSYDHAEDLVQAKRAFKEGAGIIHGIKTPGELDYITT